MTEVGRQPWIIQGVMRTRDALTPMPGLTIPLVTITLPRAERQRELISHAIGPIWEANHVWLILAIVVLFTGFPPAYARITTILHVPLFLMLLGIVQYPHLIKPDLTLGDAAAPPITLKLLLGALAAGLVLLVPSFLYLFRVFGKVRRRPG